MRKLNNLEAVELLKGYPEAVRAYNNNDYIICQFWKAGCPYYQIMSNAGWAITTAMSQGNVISWFLDLAIEDTSDGWEEMVDV